MRLPRFLRTGLLATALLATPSWSEVQVVRNDASGVRLVVEVDPRATSGLPHGRAPSGVALPYVAHLLAAPPGASLSVTVRSHDHTVLRGTELPDADSVASELKGDHLRALAHTQYLGRLRGVPAHSLHVYPWQYDGTDLLIHTKLTVDIRFTGATATRPAAQPDRAGAGLRTAFINPPAHGGWTAARPRPARRAAAIAYDPSRPWVRVIVSDDGVFRITPDWLLSAGVDANSIDPRTLALFYLGEAQPVLVRGEQDGSFDDGDELLFPGRYRRATTIHGERDHESEFGPANTYWLTWGGDDAVRFSDRDVAPVHGYTPRDWYDATAHFEEDKVFDVLAAAPDSLADRWFGQQPGRWVQAVDPDRPASGTFVGDLTGLYQDETYDARVTVALQGRVGEDFGDHHTIVSLNGVLLAEDYWSGQTSHVVSAVVPSSTLKQRNRILLQAIADRIRFDQLWFNWFRIDYRRAFHVHPGYIDAATPAAPDGQRITLEGFSSPDVVLFDVAAGNVLTGAHVEAVDSLFVVSFDDASDTATRYIAADASQFLTPVASTDQPSNWRTASAGAEYVIVTPAAFRVAAERLADHRRGDGLKVAVVILQDLFDEFSWGRFDRDAIGDFVSYAYHQWQVRPAMLLLLGDETWDYRGKYTGRRDQQLIPTQYYLARRRGYSPSDFRLSLVDGDDLLADLSIGRLAVDSAEEADAVVDKVISYDDSPPHGDWRSRSLFAANWHAKDEFSGPLDSMAVRYTEPLGLQSVRLYAEDEAPLPNPVGQRFVSELNRGALVANFSGHGAAGTMQYLFTTQQREWDYLSQVRNGGRLPLVMALSCLNGLFTDPHTEGLSELFTEWPHGGAIAYISATAISFTSQNALLQEGLYSQFFNPEDSGAQGTDARETRFGPVLDIAKARLLAAHPGWVDVPQTMQLTGDPAQRLALPPGPDYAAVRVDVSPSPAVRGQSAQVSVVLANHTRLGPAGPLVTLLGRSSDGVVDTLLRQLRPPFAGVDTITIDWPVPGPGPGSGSADYDLQLFVDADNAINELDESNNQTAVSLRLVDAPLAAPFLPAEGASVAEPTLQALMPMALVSAQDGISAPRATFALSADPTFPDSSTHVSAPVVSLAGRATHTFDRPSGATDLFWRVRVEGDAVTSIWSPARTLRLVDELDANHNDAVWQQHGRGLMLGQMQSLELQDTGLVFAAEPQPFRPAQNTREDGFTVLDLPGAGVVATDGAYLYAKRWFNDASTIYAGTDRFTRIGTGLGGTIRGGYYGVLSDSTTAGISATYHGDGYIYSDSGHLFELERIDPQTGKLDTVSVPEGLLDWSSGRVISDAGRASGQVLHAMITSDGHQIYNVSMSSSAGTRVGWGVRVFDVDADGWHLQREFVIPPTETGFTFRWTDGIFADGDNIYLMEFDGKRRIRAVRADDGTFVDEWTSDQDVTRVISGQYDWTNDRVWLGDLHGSGLFRYRRSDGPPGGQLTSPAIGPAAAWTSLRIDAVGVRVIVQGGNSKDQWTTVDSLISGDQLDLSHIDAQRYRHLRLIAHVDSSSQAQLSSWSTNFVPASDLEITDVRLIPDTESFEVHVAVRNRGSTAAPVTRLDLLTRSGRELLARDVPSLSPGDTALVQFVTTSAMRAEALRVWLRTDASDADAGNDRADVPDSDLPGAGAVVARTWPQGQRLYSGDAVSAGQAILLQATTSAQLIIQVDGEDRLADTSWVEATGARATLRLEGGHRQLTAHPRGYTDQQIALTLDVRNALAVTNALVVPNPVGSDGALFTAFLSQAAEIRVDIYSVSGRRIHQLEPISAEAGFVSVAWNGRDGAGGALAAGAYLYVISARSADARADRRGALVVAPQ